jgi:septin family protein
MQDLKEITEEVLYENYRIETVRHACMHTLVVQLQSTVLGRVHSLAAVEAHPSAQNMCRMCWYA